MAKKFLLAIIPCLLLIIEISNAQQNLASVERAVGVIWSAPDDPLDAQKQLGFFSSLGIRYLQIDEALPTSVWKHISALNFHVYALLPIRFPIASAFEKKDSVITKNSRQLLKQFSSHQSVKAIGIFAYGPEKNAHFKQQIQRFITSIAEKINKPVFYVSSKPAASPLDFLFDFKIVHLASNSIHIRSEAEASIGGYSVPIFGASRQALVRVKHAMQTVHKIKQVPVFLDGDKLLALINKFPKFGNTLAHYTMVKGYPLPVSQIEPLDNTKTNLITILLLICWLLFSVTYFLSPIYRQSFYRYFTGHQFFLTDVFERHIRTPLPGISILIQQVILTGIVFFCMSQSFISPLGKNALLYHYPFLSLLGQSNITFLLWGFITALFFEVLCVCWLLFTNPKLKHFTQILNLYPWVFQVNILVVTIMVTVIAAGWAQWLLIVAGVLFILITLAPFIIASLDAVKLLRSRHRAWTISGTLVLYTGLLLVLIIWISLSPQLKQVLGLAFTI